MAAASCAAFDLEARQRSRSSGSNLSQSNRQTAVPQPNTASSAQSGKKNSQSHPPRLQPRHYSTMRPTPSYSTAGLPSQPVMPPAFMPASSVPMPVQMLAAQQQQTQAMHVLHYQQQQQAYWQQLQQQQQQQQAMMHHFFPPAQTPSFGLSPSVSSAVPYSYSFPSGAQWSWQQ